MQTFKLKNCHALALEFILSHYIVLEGASYGFHTAQCYMPLNLISINYRLITAYLLLQVNLDKIMHAR